MSVIVAMKRWLTSLGIPFSSLSFPVALTFECWLRYAPFLLTGKCKFLLWVADRISQFSSPKFFLRWKRKMSSFLNISREHGFHFLIERDVLDSPFISNAFIAGYRNFARDFGVL